MQRRATVNFVLIQGYLQLFLFTHIFKKTYIKRYTVYTGIDDH